MKEIWRDLIIRWIEDSMKCHRNRQLYFALSNVFIRIFFHSLLNLLVQVGSKRVVLKGWARAYQDCDMSDTNSS